MNGIFQVQTDITVGFIPRCIQPVLTTFQQLLPCPFGYKNYSMFSLIQSVFKSFQQAVLPFQHERNLGNQTYVHITGGQSGMGSYKS